MTTNSTKSPSNHHPSTKLSYTARDAAAMLGISVRSLTRLEQRGIIKASKALRCKLYSHEALCRFLEETTR